MWFKMQRATEALLCDHPGNLRFHRVVDPTDDRFRSYRLSTPGKAAHLNSMPLVAWDVLRSTLLGVVDRPGSYFRRAAVTCQQRGSSVSASPSSTRCRVHALGRSRPDIRILAGCSARRR